MNALMLISFVAFAFTVTTALHALGAAFSRYRARKRALERAFDIVKAMLEGHRPIVTRPPAGKTMREAQDEVDQIWASLQVRRHRGTGGKVN